MNRIAEQVFFSVFFAIHLPPIEEGEFLLYIMLNIQLTVAPITKPILAVVKSPFKVPSANPTTAPTYQLLKSLANVKVSSSSF